MASSVLRARLIGWSPLPVGRARSGRFLSKERTMMLEPQSLIVWLVIGLIAGWLAGQIVKGYGFGLVGNLVIGVVGAFIGGWLLGLLDAQPAGFETFMRTLAEPAQTRSLPPATGQPPDPARMMAVAAEYGIEILGPPGIPG